MEPNELFVVVCESDPLEFASRVNFYLNAGYTLRGDMMVTHVGNPSDAKSFIQALVYVD